MTRRTSGSRDTTAARKSEVLRIIARDPAVDRRRHWFDEVRLIHRALPEVDHGEIDPSIEFMGKRLAFPLLISSMTGGTGSELKRINQRLAEAAEETRVAMGVGSQRVMFTHPASRGSFEVRRWAPTTLIFSNLGAVQLNYGFDLQHCRAAVETTGADALIFHLNPLQEAVQPEGNRNFAGLAAKIGRIAATLGRPVIVKEVGAGLSPADVERLLREGVRYFDVAGTGGTSWSRIEHHRTGEGPEGLGLRFQDWGWPTPLALRLLSRFRPRATLIASGGLRSGVDMVKALVLGASLCGVALPFLEAALVSTKAVIERILQFKREFATAMFLLGVRRAPDLIGREDLLMPDWGPAAPTPGGPPEMREERS